MIEREVKLGAWPGMRLPDLDGVLPSVTVLALPAQRLSATYYDTADLRLARWGVTVRYRTAEPAGGDEPPWTVKLPEGLAAGSLVRREIGFAGPEGRVPATVMHLVRGLARGAPLAAVARLRTDRLRLALRDADGREVAELDDDEVSVLAGRRLAARFREIEVELAEGADPAILDAAVSRLQAAGAGAPDPTPKVVRALGPGALEPPDVALVSLRRDATLADVVRAAIAASAARLMRHDPGVRLGDDAEDVHQARVATRRLRSDLRTFRDLLDPDWMDGVRTELGWLAGLLGAVRDADVLLMRLRSHCARLPEGDAKAAAGLLRRLEDEREADRQALLEAMDSTRYSQLLDAVVAAAAAPTFAEPPDAAPGGAEAPPDPRTTRAATFLPQLVRRPWRHLKRAVDALGPAPSDEALHEVRIRAKRCRYAAEAAAPLAGKPATRFADEVAELQGVLGDFHDAIVAEAWLRSAARDAPAEQVLAAGELIALERRAAAEGRSAWKAAWKTASAKKLRAWLDAG